MQADGTGCKRPRAVAALRAWLRSRDESGIAFVWVSVLFTVMIGFGALAVDLGNGYFVAEKAQAAADAAALGGAPYLPGNLAGAQAAAQSIASINGFTNGVNGVTVTAVLGNDPSQLRVTVKQSIPTGFARAIGSKYVNVSKFAVGVADQASNAIPVDLVVIIDRSSSMSSSDLTNLKNATKGLLTYLNPANVSVALGMLGPSSTSTKCTANGTSGAYGIDSPSASSGTWIVSPYPNATPANNYQNADGTLNTSSQLVKTINCFEASSVGTDLGTPIQRAITYFSTYGRAGVQKGMIFMTDGEANEPNTQSCKFANNQATAAKAANIQLLTIGYGVTGANCADASSPSPSPYRTAAATQLLADMASPVGGVASDDNLGCTAAENQDNDNFFCEARSSDLSSVFILAATKLTTPTPRLVK